MRSPIQQQLAYHLDLVRGRRLAEGAPLDDERLRAIRERWPERIACGFECGSGWADLITAVNEILDLWGDQIRFSQIKEKLAGLRMYFEGIDELGRVGELTDAAEELSYAVCESCGRPAKVRDRGGYIFTACDQHAGQGSTVVRIVSESARTPIGKLRTTRWEPSDE